MSTTADNAATTWRDFVDELTPEQVAELEYCEREQIPPGLADAEHQLNMARSLAQHNMIQAMCADVAAPPGTPEFVGAWEEWDGRYARLFDGCAARGRRCDGVPRRAAVRRRRYRAELTVVATDDEPMTGTEARELAAALLGAADELDAAEGAAAIAACTICDDRGHIRGADAADGTPMYRASMCRHDESEVQR